MNYLKDIPNEEQNTIDISQEVIAIIASKAALEVKGVAGMSGGIGNEIVNMLGRENLSKGVKVNIENNKAIVDIYVIINYGFRIPEVAWDIQENVAKSIIEMTEMEVEEINIHIQGINSDI